MLNHIPIGDPCTRCGMAALKHRPEHKCVGETLCDLCGLPPASHAYRDRKNKKDSRTARVRIQSRPEHRPVGPGPLCEKCKEPFSYHRFRVQKDNRETTFLGIDGEGQGRLDHRYVFLGVATETGDKKWGIRNQNGLTTVQCLDFILNLPDHTRLFAYSFNYDLTKILQDMPDEALYLLFRPELRQRVGKLAIKGPRAVRWNGYRINLQGTKFSVAKGRNHKIIWDIWKFYQSKFVGALKDWKVGSEEMLERMTLMKDKRAEFDKESPEAVEAYCYEECQYMAELARKLVDAHTKAGLELTNFYGAGSSASAMLKLMGVKDKIQPAPPEMKEAVACGFFGGRFENSVIGEIPEEIFSYDISSAYPYQLCFLPCLVHGTWTHTRRREDIEGRDIKAAIIKYSLGSDIRTKTWGPFPFRMSNGSICYPIESGGGWVWRDEYLQGEKLFGHVQFEEAWIYHCECDCQPFEKIPGYYLERLRIGKEGPGIVLKLGCNSCYGKLAQSVGRGMFQSWIWAGIITSGCRAQFLELLGQHEDRSDVLMVATDGIKTRKQLVTPIPRDTGTFDAMGKDGIRKPLGGWEEEIDENGVFFARPGVYFPLNPTAKQIKKIKGRGVGKGVVLENWQNIVRSWKVHGVSKPVKVTNVSRFCGAKSSISRAGGGDRPYVYHRANGDTTKGEPSYGQWITRPVEMSFNPLPKRSIVNPDGQTLALRRMRFDMYSAPYKKALGNDEALELRWLTQELLEQPDIDFSEYELTESHNT
jgi:hypothetical protein